MYPSECHSNPHALPGLVLCFLLPTLYFAQSPALLSVTVLLLLSLICHEPYTQAACGTCAAGWQPLL